jgi:hypothetical protein
MSIHVQDLSASTESTHNWIMNSGTQFFFSWLNPCMVDFSSPLKSMSIESKRQDMLEKLDLLKEA